MRDLVVDDTGDEVFLCIATGSRRRRLNRWIPEGQRGPRIVGVLHALEVVGLRINQQWRTGTPSYRQDVGVRCGDVSVDHYAVWPCRAVHPAKPAQQRGVLERCPDQQFRHAILHAHILSQHARWQSNAQLDWPLSAHYSQHVAGKRAPTTDNRTPKGTRRTTRRAPLAGSVTYVRVVDEVTRSGITQAELAKAVGAGARTVQNWASGHNAPRGKVAERLLDIRTIVELLSDSYTDEGIDIWLHSRNRNLEMRRPIDLLIEGQVDRMLDEAKWLSGGM